MTPTPSTGSGTGSAGLACGLHGDGPHVRLLVGDELAQDLVADVEAGMAALAAELAENLLRHPLHAVEVVSEPGRDRNAHQLSEGARGKIGKPIVERHGSVLHPRKVDS